MQNSQKSACAVYWKQIPVQMFSYEFSEIFRNTFMLEQLCATASEKMQQVGGAQQ